MFVVVSETAERPPASVESSLKLECSMFENMKHQLAPHPRKSQMMSNIESVRRKLLDSLTSALEMVVSKQLVKSVLGVGNDVEQQVEEGDLCRLAHFETLDKVSIDINKEHGEVETMCNTEVLRFKLLAERKPSGNVDNAVRNGSDVMTEETAGERQANLSTVTIAKESGGLESPVEPKYSQKEEALHVVTGSVVDGENGGLHLMDRAKRVAWNVEMNMFSVYGGVNKKYKEKARSLLFNLKDRSNPELRARVFNGEITPEILVRMSATQLASKELCEWRIAKAEEFASMVVLTDTDVDPRRILKKTHKGEFQLVAEENMSSINPKQEIFRIQPTFPVNDESNGESEARDSIFASVGKRAGKWQNPNNLSINEDEGDGQATCQSLGLYEILKETADDSGSDHPKLKSQRASFDLLAKSSVRYGAYGTLDKAPVETARDKISKSLPNLPEIGLVKPNKTSGKRSADVASISKKRERDTGAAVWVSSIQLSATRCAPLHGFYKSGERLEFEDWPQSVEVKGRVRLEALDKFLHDLQLSRSRTVTVLSLCHAESKTGVKHVGTYLNEMADHYRTGDRAGFVEPKPGFELYLLAPGSTSLGLLRLKMTCRRDDEVLLGVVVWRKGYPQGLPSSRRLDQNIRCKKVAMSNLESNGPAEASAKPLWWTGTLKSGEGMPAYLHIGPPSFINVSRNSSMPSTQSRADSSDLCNPSDDKEGHHSSGSIGLQLFPLVTSQSTVAETQVGIPAYKHPLLQLVDHVDVPPGFIPRPTESTPELPSIVGGVSGQLWVWGSDGNKESSRSAPAGVWFSSSARFPLPNTQKKGTASLEEDDLPEFNYDADGGVLEKSANYLSAPNQTPVLTSHNHDSGTQSFGQLQYNCHPVSRYHAHYNYYHHNPTPKEFQPVFIGLPSKNVPHQGKSVAHRSVFPCIERWSSAERVSETANTVPDDNMMLYDAACGNEKQGGFTEDIISHEEFWKGGQHPQRLSVPSTRGPLCFATSEAAFLNGAFAGPRSYLSKGGPFERCSASSISKSGCISVPLPLTDNSLHNNQHLPLQQMAVQQHPPVMKNNALNWPRGIPVKQPISQYNLKPST